MFKNPIVGNSLADYSNFNAHDKSIQKLSGNPPIRPLIQS